MKVLKLTDEEHEQLVKYLVGQREVNGQVMEDDDLQDLNDLITVVEGAADE